MAITYDVNVWSIEVYKGTRGNSYRVAWRVAGRRWKETFKVKALADSFRAELMTAWRKGEGFDTETGRPFRVAEAKTPATTWYDHACAFVDMKWPHGAATTRRTHAEALTAATVLLLKTDEGRPDAKLLRLALTRWTSMLQTFTS